MKLFKKNKFTIFIIVFFMVLLVLLLQAKNLFFPNSGVENYGDRLKDLPAIQEDVMNSATDALKGNEKVVDASIRTQGKIVEVQITLQNDVNLQDAKTIGTGVTASFDETTLANYDFQVFLLKESEEENNFPIIGYKAKTSEGFTFTKDREKTVEEEKAE